MPADHAIVRFEGGPFDGKQMGTAVWPPPERVTIADILPVADHVLGEQLGFYERTSWSQLTDEEVASPHLMRGVKYTWKDPV